MGLRAIDAAVFSESVVHRVERVPDWTPLAEGPEWRSLCGARVGETGKSGLFEFAVSVALDPESWRLVANCQACRVAAQRRELGNLT